MELKNLPLAPRFQPVLDTCEPFLISYSANLSALDLAPFGVEVRPERCYTPTARKSRDIVDGLHRLDALTFGDQAMLMPRWVLFDCGEFPGIVFGFGRRARELPGYVCEAFRVGHDDDDFVPLSMWVAIRCAEPGGWFGHNLSSANLILNGNDELPGLALLTKVLGVKLARCTKQYGATQWSSGSIGLHLRLGTLELLSAYTPAHTHPDTFAYRVDVDEERLTSSLLDGWQAPHETGHRVVIANDLDGLRHLQDEIEDGVRFGLMRCERRRSAAQRLHLRRLDDES